MTLTRAAVAAVRTGAAAAPVRQLRPRVVFDSPRIRVRRDEVLFESEPGDYTIVEACDYAVVVPLDRGGVWLVEQFRYAVGRRSWEFPAGTWPIEADDTAADAFVGAVRGSLSDLAAAELVEETGFRADSLEFLGCFFPSIGCSRQRAHVFVADGLRPGRPRREVTERDMVMRWFSFDAVRAMVLRGDIVDMSTALTVNLVLEHLRSTLPK